MHPTIMITDGGPHPADKWAVVTAKHIAGLIEISEKSISPDAVAARKAKPRFELDLADALEGHHQAVQHLERGKIKDLGAVRLSHSCDADEHAPQTVAEALAAVVSAAKGTPFEAHFAQPAVQQIVRGMIVSHFSHAMHIERSWHADRHPDNEHAKRFRDRFHPQAETDPSAAQ